MFSVFKLRCFFTLSNRVPGAPCDQISGTYSSKLKLDFEKSVSNRGTAVLEPLSTSSLIRFSFKIWENVLFELGSERDNLFFCELEAHSNLT